MNEKTNTPDDFLYTPDGTYVSKAMYDRVCGGLADELQALKQEPDTDNNASYWYQCWSTLHDAAEQVIERVKAGNPRNIESILRPAMEPWREATNRKDSTS
jgi:hypothetical protein